MQGEGCLSEGGQLTILHVTNAELCFGGIVSYACPAFVSMLILMHHVCGHLGRMYVPTVR